MRRKVKQLDLFIKLPYVRPLTIKVDGDNLNLKYVHSEFNPSLEAVCLNLCKFKGLCLKSFSSVCASMYFASSCKLSYYFD